MVMLADGSLLHIQRVRLASATFGIQVVSSPDAIHYNLETAVNRESQRIRDERVLAECEESWRKAHAQLYGGAR
jgi:hypothetical protein